MCYCFWLDDECFNLYVVYRFCFINNYSSPSYHLCILHCTCMMSVFICCSYQDLELPGADKVLELEALIEGEFIIIIHLDDSSLLYMYMHWCKLMHVLWKFIKLLNFLSLYQEWYNWSKSYQLTFYHFKHFLCPPEGGTYSFCSCSRAVWCVRRPQLTLSDHLKKKLWIYLRQTFYMDIRWHKLGWYWFSTISEKQDGHLSQFSADSEFWRRLIN